MTYYDPRNSKFYKKIGMVLFYIYVFLRFVTIFLDLFFKESINQSVDSSFEIAVWFFMIVAAIFLLISIILKKREEK